MKQTDAELLEKAQRLLAEKSQDRPDLKLNATEVARDSDIVRVLVSHAEGAYLEDYVHILASVEADLDVDDDVTVILVPVVDEEAA